MIYRYSSKRAPHTHTLNRSFPIGLLRFVNMLIHIWILRRRTWHATSPKCMYAQEPFFPHYLLRQGSLEWPDLRPPGLSPKIQPAFICFCVSWDCSYHLGPTLGFQKWTPIGSSEQPLLFRELSFCRLYTHVQIRCCPCGYSCLAQADSRWVTWINFLETLELGRREWFGFCSCGWIYSMYTGEMPWWYFLPWWYSWWYFLSPKKTGRGGKKEEVKRRPWWSSGLWFLLSLQALFHSCSCTFK